MSKKRHQYSREFKLRILAEIDDAKGVNRVARENGLNPSMVSRWKSELAEDPEDAFKGNGNTYKTEARIAQLERLLGQAHVEIEFLKNALERQMKARELDGLKHRMKSQKEVTR